MSFYADLRDLEHREQYEIGHALGERLKRVLGPSIGDRNHGGHTSGQHPLSYRRAVEILGGKHTLTFYRGTYGSGYTRVQSLGLWDCRTRVDGHENDLSRRLGHRSGILASLYDPHEFACQYWTSHRHNESWPDLFEDQTFAAWLSLLGGDGPVSVSYHGNHCVIDWSRAQTTASGWHGFRKFRNCAVTDISVFEHRLWRVNRAYALVAAFETRPLKPIREVLAAMSPTQGMDSSWSNAVTGRDGIPFEEKPEAYDAGSQVGGPLRMTPSLIPLYGGPIDYSAAPEW